MRVMKNKFMISKLDVDNKNNLIVQFPIDQPGIPGENQSVLLEFPGQIDTRLISCESADYRYSSRIFHFQCNVDHKYMDHRFHLPHDDAGMRSHGE